MSVTYVPLMGASGAMKISETVDFVSWVTQLAWALEKDKAVRDELAAGKALRVQFELPVEFFVVGSGSEWATGVGKVFAPRVKLQASLEAFSELLQGKLDASKVKIEGNVDELLALFKALSKAQSLPNVPENRAPGKK